MINFLISLANKLDQINAVKLANNVDNLIVKLSQEYGPNQNPFPAIFDNLSKNAKTILSLFEKTPIDNKFKTDNFKKINSSLLDFLKVFEGLDPADPRTFSYDFISILNDVTDGNQILTNWLLTPVSGSSPNQTMEDFTSKIEDAINNFIADLSTLAEMQKNDQLPTEKEKSAPKQRQQNKQTTDLIVNIQTLLGYAGYHDIVAASGKWDAQTNKAFLDYMRKRHPDYVNKQNKFTQNLQQAYNMMYEDFDKEQPAAMSAQPQAPKSIWKSKYGFKLDHLATLLSNIETLGRGTPGNAQKAIDMIENSIDSTRRLNQSFMMSQQDFERQLNSIYSRQAKLV